MPWFQISQSLFALPTSSWLQEPEGSRKKGKDLAPHLPLHSATYEFMGSVIKGHSSTEVITTFSNSQGSHGSQHSAGYPI